MTPDRNGIATHGWQCGQSIVLTDQSDTHYQEKFPCSDVIS